MSPNAEVRRLGLISVLVVALSACAGQPRLDNGIQAEGDLQGHPISARLDAEIARYYLEDYPEPHPNGWHEQLAEYESELGSDRVDQAFLATVAERYGSLDLAALFFMQHVLSQAENQRWQTCLSSTSQILREQGFAVLDGLTDASSPYKVIFAPGWLYEDHPQTEADFASTRRSLDQIDFPYRFVATPQDGTVTENAHRLAEVIREYQDQDTRLILVSASKAAAELVWTLGALLEPAESASVAAWINAGGVVTGTPLADSWTRFPRSIISRAAFFWYGWDYASLRSMRSEDGRERLAQATIPADILLINYVAVPMTSQVSQAGARRHRALSQYGPSDALTPLMGSKVAGRITVLEKGTDHYFFDVDIRLRTLALTRMVVTYLEGDFEGKC